MPGFELGLDDKFQFQAWGEPHRVPLPEWVGPEGLCWGKDLWSKSELKGDFPGCRNSLNKGPRSGFSLVHGGPQGLELPENIKHLAAVLEPYLLSPWDWCSWRQRGRQHTVGLEGFVYLEAHQCQSPGFPAVQADIRVSFPLGMPGIVILKWHIVTNFWTFWVHSLSLEALRWMELETT